MIPVLIVALNEQKRKKAIERRWTLYYKIEKVKRFIIFGKVVGFQTVVHYSDGIDVKRFTSKKFSLEENRKRAVEYGKKGLKDYISA